MQLGTFCAALDKLWCVVNKHSCLSVQACCQTGRLVRHVGLQVQGFNIAGVCDELR